MSVSLGKHLVENVDYTMVEVMMKHKPVYRVTTFVPPEHLDRLIEGISRVARCDYGKYEHVFWWSAPGIEQFRPLIGSHPTVGQIGVTSRTPSIKIEFCIPKDPHLLDIVIRDGLIHNHPWEEPVIYIEESLAVLSQDGQ